MVELKNLLLLLLLPVTLLNASDVFAQTALSIEDIYQGKYRPKSVDAVNWMNDGNYYTALEDNKIVKYEITSGSQVEVLVDGNALSPNLSIDHYEFSNDEQLLLLLTDQEYIYRRSFVADYFIFHLEEKTLTQLSENGSQSYATFSPDGSKVAFARENNLFYVDLATMTERAVTEDGVTNKIIHGSTDWVYEEEFSITKGFFWAPDGKKIAYYTFDESEVEEYNLQLWGYDANYPTDYRFKYPKAGEANSKIGLTIYDLESYGKTEVDLGEETDIYIPRVQWTKDPGLLSVLRLNRLQNQLEILHVDATSGGVFPVYKETTNTYIDLNFTEEILYLEDGKHFIISSEKDGFKHLYLYQLDGRLIRQITSGSWEVNQLVGVDQTGKKAVLYYLSTEVSPLDRTLYRIDIYGKKKEILSPPNGTTRVDMSKDFKYDIRYYSNAQTPLKVSLYQTPKNKEIKVLEQNEALAKFTSEVMSPKEFFTFPTTDGSNLNAYMLRPRNFNEQEKYPVLIFQYSGPNSQQVREQWGGGNNFLWHQLLAQQGYVVVVADPRGTGGRGADFKKITYGQLGKYEVEDHIELAKYMAGNQFVDKDRIGIWGWSYGGYISSLAMMRGSDFFKTGIAVAPVTSWRFYDTIYTERYLKRPQDNPSGYDDNSPLTHASKLTGNFLLVHGTGDDNVHYQNSIALQDEFIVNNIQFDSFFYPDRAHGIADYNARVHLFTMMTDFLKENL